MLHYLLLGLCLTVCHSSDSKDVTQDLIKGYGYPVETHVVTTDDGYILKLHRIPAKHKNRPPVLLMHGLMLDSSSWFNKGPNRSLGFLLADEHNDVWIGNSRGNKYSREHVYLSPDKPDGKFWDFSWHEMGVYDLPAMIDYILKRTKHKDLVYIGFSQGATMGLVMGSERPNYNSKIRLMIALAPAVYFRHSKSIGSIWTKYQEDGCHRFHSEGSKPRGKGVFITWQGLVSSKPHSFER